MNNYVWYMIPGFNGYEINEEKEIRSFKFHNVNTYGRYIKMYTDRHGKKYVYLSDDNNKRRKMYVDELWDLVKNNKNKYIRSGTDRYLGSRNKIINKDPVSDIDNNSSWTPLDMVTKLYDINDHLTPEVYNAINEEMVNLSNIFNNLGIQFEYNIPIPEEDESNSKISPIVYD